MIEIIIIYYKKILFNVKNYYLGVPASDQVGPTQKMVCF
jgi:hypothetical protein